MYKPKRFWQILQTNEKAIKPMLEFSRQTFLREDFRIQLFIEPDQQIRGFPVDLARGKDQPCFGLPVGRVQVFARVRLGRMDLQRELFGGVQQLHQHGRIRPVPADMSFSQQFDRVLRQIFGKRNEPLPQPDPADPVSG